MIYRFCIVSDEIDNFKREIAIDADDSFLKLRNAILDSVGYTKDQMDSFFICDDDWSKKKEITLADMGSDSDEDIWIMDETPLSDLIEDDGQKILYVFDYMTDRAFFIEMKESIPGKNLQDPVCQKKEGNPPAQFVDIEVVNEKATPATPISDLDEDFYGDESYKEDEFDAEGYDDLNLDNN